MKEHKYDLCSFISGGKKNELEDWKTDPLCLLVLC